MPTDSERWKLEGFRRAAQQIRDASIIARAQSIELHVVPGEPGYTDILVRLLENEAFRSLALAVRLVYQQGEPAHFFSVCNVLARHGSPEIRTRVAALRREYKEALQDQSRKVTIGDDTQPAVFTTQEVFDHWLYGVVFHQDEDRQHAVARLAASGAFFLWSVQETALQLSVRVLDLDDVIADFLGEPRAPRQ